jgi:hypothetical protein
MLGNCAKLVRMNYWKFFTHTHTHKKKIRVTVLSEVLPRIANSHLWKNDRRIKYEGVSKSFRTESKTKYTLTKINTR